MVSGLMNCRFLIWLGENSLQMGFVDVVEYDIEHIVYAIREYSHTIHLYLSIFLRSIVYSEGVLCAYVRYITILSKRENRR